MGENRNSGPDLDTSGPIARQLDLRIEAQIRSQGYGLVSIDSDGQTPPFCYTSGLSRQGVPDLIVFGLKQTLASQLITAAVSRHVPAWPYSRLALEDVLGNYQFEMRPVEMERAHGQFMLHAARHDQRSARQSVGAVQIFWPDSLGALPFDPDCEPRTVRVQLQLDLIDAATTARSFRRGR